MKPKRSVRTRLKKAAAEPAHRQPCELCRHFLWTNPLRTPIGSCKINGGQYRRRGETCRKFTPFTNDVMRAEPPAEAKRGDVYINTTTLTLCRYDGHAWIETMKFKLREEPRS